MGAALRLEYSVANFLVRSSGGGGIELALDLVVVEESSLVVWICAWICAVGVCAVGGVGSGREVRVGLVVGAIRCLVGRLSVIGAGGVGWSGGSSVYRWARKVVLYVYRGSSFFVECVRLKWLLWRRSVRVSPSAAILSVAPKVVS